tara:strand:+ start:1079 stop:1663 length:585 start_codon:yes stop_codon:yes gene_type:complete
LKELKNYKIRNMRKRVLTIKDHKNYRENQYDDMKNMLNIARSLNEQTEFDIDIDTDIDIEKKREKEKTKTYTISSGKLIIHGQRQSELNLTDDERNSYQETMDDFVEQVSDLVDFRPLQLYRNNVEWGGRLIKEDLDFFFSLGESNGVFISGNMVRVDNDFVETIEKLRSFYEIFSAKWAKVLGNRKITDTEDL